MDTINIFVGRSSSGEKVYEEIPVLLLKNEVLRLMASPGLVEGLAKGDEIKFERESGRFEIVKRGGNICVQLFVLPNMTDVVDSLEKQVAERLCGTLDGRTPEEAAFTIHVSKGFADIEQVFNLFVEKNPGAEWCYGNVYDIRDGVTPLNWWLEKNVVL